MTKGHQRIQHAHALDRLRERYMPEAEMADIEAIRDIASEAAKGVKSLPDRDVKQVFVAYRGLLIHVLYCPRHRALRTVLPR